MSGHECDIRRKVFMGTEYNEVFSCSQLYSSIWNKCFVLQRLFLYHQALA